MVNLLIVEDNIEFLSHLQDEIVELEQDLEWRVDVVTGLNGAKKKCQSNEYDLALVDIILPDGRGSELLDFFRILGVNVDSVMISVLNDPRTVLECIRLGAVG